MTCLLLNPLVGTYDQDHLLDSDLIGVVHDLGTEKRKMGKSSVFGQCIGLRAGIVIRSAVVEVVKRAGGNPRVRFTYSLSEVGKRSQAGSTE